VSGRRVVRRDRLSIAISCGHRGERGAGGPHPRIRGVSRPAASYVDTLRAARRTGGRPVRAGGPRSRTSAAGAGRSSTLPTGRAAHQPARISGTNRPESPEPTTVRGGWSRRGVRATRQMSGQRGSSFRPTKATPSMSGHRASFFRPTKATPSMSGHRASFFRPMKATPSMSGHRASSFLVPPRRGKGAPLRGRPALPDVRGVRGRCPRSQPVRAGGLRSRTSAAGTDRTLPPLRARSARATGLRGRGWWGRCRRPRS